MDEGEYAGSTESGFLPGVTGETLSRLVSSGLTLDRLQIEGGDLRRDRGVAGAPGEQQKGDDQKELLHTFTP